VCYLFKLLSILLSNELKLMAMRKTKRIFAQKLRVASKNNYSNKDAIDRCPKWHWRINVVLFYFIFLAFVCAHSPKKENKSHGMDWVIALGRRLDAKARLLLFPALFSQARRDDIESRKLSSLDSSASSGRLRNFPPLVLVGWLRG